ncbi:trigger factor [Granulibacter bethesdensis]|uniref:trigger factor n=1 Tax=Granulibacter bethesdensis TaxID=364410 RepID=UPI0003F20409|nr:trigger factor [Granulibacter bethesdensis]AHJ66251.1 Trigger factor, ppiase [Granulibacter bethesdensis CGDNIH4]
MQVTETLSEGLKRGFTVQVPATDIEERRTRRLAELAKTLKLPGFRPGKVPMTLVRQRYGRSVETEVLEETVNEATQTMVSERGLRPALQPKVELVRVDLDQDVEFKVELELLPDITLPDLGSVSLTRLKSEPSAEAVDKALEEIAQRQRNLEPVEEVRPAQKGDFLTVDFVGKTDGVAFQGGTGTDMDVEIAGTGFIPGFSEQMEGLSVGETRVIDVTFPEEYGVPELAGKAAQFEITAKALKKAVAPVIDDAFATKLGLDSLEKLREIVTQQIQNEYDQVSRLRVKRALLDALADQAGFEVPPTLVENEFNQIWQRVDADRKADRLDEDDKGKDEDTLRADYRKIAERRVRLGLLLAEIGRVNGVQVGNDELIRAMRAEASRYPGQEQAVLDFFRQNPQAIDSLRGPIFEEKVVDFVLETAKVDDKIVSIEELNADEDVAGIA